MKVKRSKNKSDAVTAAEELEALERTWSKVRDLIDDVRERILTETVAEHIGKCFMDVQRNRETNEPEVYSYYKVLGVEGNSVLYAMLHIQVNGLVQIEPRHRSGDYIIKNYMPISAELFGFRCQALMNSLQKDLDA